MVWAFDDCLYHYGGYRLFLLAYVMTKEQRLRILVLLTQVGFVLIAIAIVGVFVLLMTGCTAGRDACYICLNPSLEIEIAKQKRKTGENNGRGCPQSCICEEDGHTPISCPRIQPSR